jgi:hypothetical protein
MLSCISLRRLAPVLVALGVFALGCASEPATDADEAAVQDVSSALPLAAVSMDGAEFAGLGIGGAAGGPALGAPAVSGTVGTTSTVGGAPLSFGTSFGSGPMGSSSGPIGFGSSLGTGPITTGNTVSMSSANGGMPVINQTCSGIVCL